MHTITRAVLVGLLSALAAAPAAAETVKIGFITTLSGPQGAIGEHMKSSVELALDHLGRKIGGLDVEIVYGDAMLTKVMEIAARQLLLAGVTTEVDLGAPLKQILDVRDRINKGQIVGTRVLASGPWISRGAGGAMQEGFGGQNITSPAEAATKVDELANAGIDLIKAHSGLTAEDYNAIADAAHRHHIRVHAHVYAERDVRNALENGIDVLQHVGSAGTAPPYSEKSIIEDTPNAAFQRRGFTTTVCQYVHAHSDPVPSVSVPGGLSPPLDR